MFKSFRKKRSSISTKITLTVVGFAIFVVTAAWLLNNFLITSIFMWNLKKNLTITFNSCNELFANTDVDNVKNGDLLGEADNPSDAVVMIFDKKNENIYTTISDESRMMESLHGLIKSVEKEKEKGQLEKGKFIIQKHADPIINADYFDLIGILDNGNYIIVRSPIARIEITMHIVNTIFIYVATALVIFGSLFILGLSKVFAVPVKRMSEVAMRMAQLDFDVKVPITSNDEIGELGSYMNEMSSTLERTISELKAANIQLQKDIKEREEIDEMRKEFLSHVSHELKTPIALIQGYAEGLKDNISDDPESMDFYTDVIIDEAHKMNLLVKKLLTLNEIEFGNTPLKIERFELVGFIQDIIDASKILIEEAKAKIIFLEKAPQYVWADEYMIEGVVTNYLTNAIHYVEPNGEIRVWFEEHGNDLRVCIYNQGKTIADEDIDKLFLKFYKADKARTREYGGNGIGLSIVAATMEAHGKQYGVYNKENGVVFYFDLDANMLVDN